MWNIIERGGYVMYPLLAASAVALAIVIERALFWIIVSLRTRLGDVEEVLDVAADFPVKAEQLAHAGTRSPIMRVLSAGLEHRTSGYREALEMSAEREISLMRRGHMVLDTIVTLAPLLGILGTVVGIIQSFELLGEATINDPRGVSSGIAEALITTAAGLAIAIGTLIPFNYFSARVEKYAHVIEQAATRLEIALIRWCRKEGIDVMDAREQLADGRPRKDASAGEL